MMITNTVATTLIVTSKESIESSNRGLEIKMARLSQELIGLLNDPATVKVVSTTDARGVPHAVAKGSLTTLDEELIAWSEGFDSSTSNKNLVGSIWFDRTVAINATKGAVSYQIKGKLYKCLIAGPIFKSFLQRARERRGPEADIAAVWLLVPEEERNESPAVRGTEEAEKRPFFHQHLDNASIKAS